MYGTFVTTPFAPPFVKALTSPLNTFAKTLGSVISFPKYVAGFKFPF